MNPIALQESVSKLNGPVTDYPLLGKTFIWLPFVGGMSAFAVTLPNSGVPRGRRVATRPGSRVDRKLDTSWNSGAPRRGHQSQ
jgi:hypothetical protein